MTEPPTLEQIDREGALRDAAEAAGVDRRVFVRTAAGTALGAGIFGLPTLADARISSRASRRNDLRILNFALLLEYLEASFYQAALFVNDFERPDVTRFAQAAGDHEAQHVAFLQATLDGRRVAKPTFAFGDAISPARFLTVAVALEDTGVGAYLAQGPRLRSRELITAVDRILTVESRHASWARFLAGGSAADAPDAALPAPAALEAPRDQATVLATVGATGFVTSAIPTDRI
ncbi:ferritin-like domain-containing protein [Patulibacter americanus]|uniref:ferritin-like domain-containing protein n=1 Tax=Patulibacter americanus TaxID=588672 RepID=UPI0003B2E2B7|nr:ferritin-like domain-containing protein [Patulibacter americanus]